MDKTHYVVSKTNTRNEILYQQWKADAYEPSNDIVYHNPVLLTYTVIITIRAFRLDHELTKHTLTGELWGIFVKKYVVKRFNGTSLLNMTSARP